VTFFVDANVIVYAATDGPYRDPCVQVLEAVASGAVVVGSPDTVRQRLVATARDAGFDYLVLMLAFGTLGHAAELRSLDLFRREVMPALAEEKAAA